MDKISKEQRSALMSKVRSSNTKFEIDFISFLSDSTNISFETHAKDIRGTPDIVFRNEKICIFLDSDFWHGWRYPTWKNKLKDDFWRNKIEKNRRRDRLVTRSLRRAGWTVIRVWQHQLSKTGKEIKLHEIIKSIELAHNLNRINQNVDFKI